MEVKVHVVVLGLDGPAESVQKRQAVESFPAVEVVDGLAIVKVVFEVVPPVLRLLGVCSSGKGVSVFVCLY